MSHPAGATVPAPGLTVSDPAVRRQALMADINTNRGCQVGLGRAARPAAAAAPRQ